MNASKKFLLATIFTGVLFYSCGTTPVSQDDVTPPEVTETEIIEENDVTEPEKQQETSESNEEDLVIETENEITIEEDSVETIDETVEEENEDSEEYLNEDSLLENETDFESDINSDSEKEAEVTDDETEVTADETEVDLETGVTAETEVTDETQAESETQVTEDETEPDTETQASADETEVTDETEANLETEVTSTTPDSTDEVIETYIEEDEVEDLTDETPHLVLSRNIAGEGVLTPEQLTEFFFFNNPDEDYDRVLSLANIYIEEAAAEGINWDVAFVQMCHETGFLKFGNLVTPEMHNYCGLGAIDKDHRGEVFETEQLGVRAHIQHLHAYATTEEITLNNELIDNRYKWVKPRGKATTIFELTGTWATDPNYAEKLDIFMCQIEELFTITEPILIED